MRLATIGSSTVAGSGMFAKNANQGAPLLDGKPSSPENAGAERKVAGRLWCAEAENPQAQEKKEEAKAKAL